MDIIVKGRNVEVPDHFRVHVSDKLRRIERFDHKIIEVDVELLHERNPRQSDNCQRVEITCVSRGPVVRAEASASDFYAALEKAIDKLESRLRRTVGACTTDGTLPSRWPRPPRPWRVCRRP